MNVDLAKKWKPSSRCYPKIYVSTCYFKTQFQNLKLKIEKFSHSFSFNLFCIPHDSITQINLQFEWHQKFPLASKFMTRCSLISKEVLATTKFYCIRFPSLYLSRWACFAKPNTVILSRSRLIEEWWYLFVAQLSECGMYLPENFIEKMMTRYANKTKNMAKDVSYNFVTAYKILSWIEKFCNIPGVEKVTIKTEWFLQGQTTTTVLPKSVDKLGLGDLRFNVDFHMWSSKMLYEESC